MGPLTANFKVPVLLEVPHFASVRGGERELIVLRCDDGKDISLKDINTGC